MDLGTVDLAASGSVVISSGKIGQLSLSLSQKLAEHWLKTYQLEEKGKETINTLKTAKSLTSFTTPPKQLDSRRRRQLDVGSPGEVMRSKPRPSLNRSAAAASSWKVLVLKLPNERRLGTHLWRKGICS